jgi:hypothetical protein
MIPPAERALLIVDKALEHKRAFLTVWEIQFLNSIRVSCMKYDDLTAPQKQVVCGVGKRLGLMD